LQFRRKRRNDGTDHIDLGFLVDIFMIDLWLNLCLTLLSWLRWNHVYLIFISIYLFILVEQEEMERQREEEGFRSDESRPDSPHIVVPPSDGFYLFFDWFLLFSSNNQLFISHPINHFISSKNQLQGQGQRMKTMKVDLNIMKVYQHHLGHQPLMGYYLFLWENWMIYF